MLRHLPAVALILNSAPLCLWLHGITDEYYVNWLSSIFLKQMLNTPVDIGMCPLNGQPSLPG